MILGILGAGASGMAAALTASENPETQVLLLERQTRVGKKLSATGNGRCNLTNLHASEGGYFGDDPAFARPALSAYPPEETLDWFRSLGLYTVSEDSGRVYPFSDQANSVVDVLRFALNRPNITLKTGFEVEKIKKNPEGFRLESAGEEIFCDRLIIAAGGLAGTTLGGSMSGYRLLMKLGHHTTRLRPALVQLKTDWAGVESLKGIRTECVARVYRNEELFAESKGQVQFTQYGLSGPVIFEVSRDVGQGERKMEVPAGPAAGDFGRGFAKRVIPATVDRLGGGGIAYRHPPQPPGAVSLPGGRGSKQTGICRRRLWKLWRN